MTESTTSAAAQYTPVPTDGDPQTRIDAAIRLIDADPAVEIDLAPSQHAKRFESSAPALARRLGRSDVLAATMAYESANADAVAAQREFDARTANARMLVLATGVLGALLLGVGSLGSIVPFGASRWIVLALSTAALITGVFAASAIRLIRDGQLVEAWMTQRAAAETARLAYFGLVVRPDATIDPLHQLEYFRRYQLDVQCAYFKQRGGEHKATADRLLSQGVMAMSVAGIAAGLAGLVVSVHPALVAIASVGLIAQAFAARAENIEATAQHRRTADRYARTRNALIALTGRLDTVRGATAAGDGTVVQEFVSAVHEQLATEHRQWIDEMAKASEAVARLEARLNEYEESAKPKKSETHS